jgi:hypothetical protein
MSNWILPRLLQSNGRTFFSFYPIGQCPISFASDDSPLPHLRNLYDDDLIIWRYGKHENVRFSTNKIK